MKKKIFISYRKEDSPWNSVALYQELSKHFPKDDIFKDFNTLVPGVDYVEKIEKELDKCDALLVLISDKWLKIEDSKGNRRLDNANDFVRLEVATALSRNINVIPVLFDNAVLPLEDEIPDNIKMLARRQAIVIDKTHFESDVERLAEAINSDKSVNPPKKSNVLKFSLFILVLLIMVFLGIKLLIPNRDAYPDPGKSSADTARPSDANEQMIKEEEIPTPATPEVQNPTGKINISFTANPYTIPAGGQADLNVLALTDDNVPIPDANVKMQAGGGWFMISKNYIEIGKTNENGVFSTKWTCPNPAARGYGINVSVNKDGLIRGEQDITINIE